MFFALCRLLSIFASLRHKIYSSEDLNGFGKLADSFEKSHHIFFLYDGKEFFSEAVVQRKGARIPRFERKRRQRRKRNPCQAQSSSCGAHRKKYANYGDNDELISIGSIGLIKAVESFKSDKGTSLATYASRCIENEILMTMRTTKKHRSNMSLNEPIGVDKDGNELVIMDMLESDQNVIEDVENSIMMEKLTAITKSVLDKREYEIIKMRYGLENTGALTQREVAKKFNISRSYVSRIEKKALEKIKKSVNKEDLT